MNTMTEMQEALRKLEQSKALLEGALAGKTIEPITGTDKNWEPIEVLLHPEEYRLKSAPKRIWVNEYAAFCVAFDNEHSARHCTHYVPNLIRTAVPYIEEVKPD